jgi:hypothetical protein
MSGKSESQKHGADMSAFEAQFQGGEFDAFLREQRDEDVRLLQIQQREQDISHYQSVFEKSMLEERMSYKSPEDKLRHLKDAYAAALFLETVDLLPLPDILSQLQNRIQAIHTLLSQRKATEETD